MEIQRSLFKTVLHQAFIASCLLFLLACEDPSNVGLGLVGDDSGKPITKPVNLATFQTTPEDGIIDNVGEFLAGQVIDPTLGNTRAVGFLDVNSNTTLSSDYRNGTIDNAILSLETSYMYGDTLEPLTFAVHEVLNEFSGFGSTTDSIPEVGPELFQFSMLPTDSLLSLDLPPAWISTKDADLRATDFGNRFHGFQLVPVAGNAVVGFHNAPTRLSGIIGVVGTDTIRYVASKSISTLTKTADAGEMSERVPIQNGVGPRISMSFNIDSLQNISLNRAVIRVPFDDSALETPTNYFRPDVEELSLHGVLSDSTSVLLAISQSNQDGYYDFISETFHGVLQQFLLGNEPYESYEIRFAGTSISSINALVLHDRTSAVASPQLILTYTELN